MDYRLKLNEELTAVYQQVLKMGTLVEESLQKAINALIHRDAELAEQVITNDFQIDTYQSTIEDHCTKIIATEQPVASDLRNLVTVIKIVSDLERIGDHARHLARSLESIDQATMDSLLPDIEKMTKKGIEMVHQSLTAFSRFDSRLARKTAEMDDQLDEQHKLLYNKIISMMKQDPDKVEAGGTLLFLNRFLERLGDHVTNICEWIVYASSGNHSELN
ncbi:phosphate signaling complex protein PhoU [Salinispira pacifica]|uniref:Phosphate-specific transport system accessory protein PhoU n=1 Tax=Salinispira pacifica TaxID=1307761 RepID=V5WFJ5_9SPIO|nr:phosphate signaling complex protein PhoU [Salinispira pacifica]AHC14334.1 Phosphate transport system regulatory protein PhoU [Salinispira pacifica]